MRLRPSLPPTIALTIFAAVSYTPEASAAAPSPPACGQGVEGIAEPGSVVCGRDDESGELYCDQANDAGAFNVVRGVVSPSTVTDCLPATGVLTFYQVDCFGLGMAVDRDDRAVAYGGPWLDIRCDRCGPGRCIGDSFVDSCVAYAPDYYISLAMCACELLDPSCGVGNCLSNGAYCEGPYCAAPVCYAPDSPISQAMCQGVQIDPNNCSGCTPHTASFTSGVDDSFSQTNRREVPSPSAGMMSWINANYGNPGTRPYDTNHSDQYFAHTFTGLAPQGGGNICGARLTTRIHNYHYNDSLALVFFDAFGNFVGPGWSDSLINLGIPVGTNSLITIDIGSLPGVGAAMLTQMQNGWLDIFVQDDAMVDFVTLEVDYCCPCVPHSTVSTAGVEDNFSLANGVEATSPSSGVLTWLNAAYPVPNSRNFDQGHADQYFAHTFTGLEPQNGGHICGARLRTRIENRHFNDSIGLYFFDASGTQVVPGWADRLSNVGFPLFTPATNTIDIGSLPGGAALLAQMENGWVDILIQDDSMVDFIELTVDYCCPCEPYDTLDTAGVADSFSLANGPEAPSPSWNLNNYMSVNWNTPASRNFDSTGLDRWFGHTFTGLTPESGAHICDATLNAVVSSQGGNDATWLFFTNNQAGREPPMYVQFISTLGVPPGNTGPISINIGSLPNGPYLLNQMELGFMDWLIQDDTAADYAELQISYCCRAVEIDWSVDPYWSPDPIPPTTDPNPVGDPPNPPQGRVSVSAGEGAAEVGGGGQ